MSTIPSPQPALPPPRPRPPLRVVEHQRRPHKGAVFALAMVMVFVALLGNAVLSSVLVTNQQRLDSLNAEVSEQKAEQQRLRLEVARLESPARIVEAAVADGMVRPDSVTWLGPQEQGDVVENGTPDAPTTEPPVDERASDAGTTDPAGADHGHADEGDRSQDHEEALGGTVEEGSTGR